MNASGSAVHQSIGTSNVAKEKRKILCRISQAGSLIVAKVVKMQERRKAFTIAGSNVEPVVLDILLNAWYLDNYIIKHSGEPTEICHSWPHISCHNFIQ